MRHIPPGGYDSASAHWLRLVRNQVCALLLGGARIHHGGPGTPHGGEYEWEQISVPGVPWALAIIGASCAGRLSIT